jgi:hypothetical protein
MGDSVWAETVMTLGRIIDYSLCSDSNKSRAVAASAPNGASVDAHMQEDVVIPLRHYTPRMWSPTLRTMALRPSTSMTRR